MVTVIYDVLLIFMFLALNLNLLIIFRSLRRMIQFLEVKSTIGRNLIYLMYTIMAILFANDSYVVVMSSWGLPAYRATLN